MSDVVIVIGAARSGTKILREILAASPNVAAVPFDVNFIWRTGSDGEADDDLDLASCGSDLRFKIRRSLFRAAGLKRSSEKILLEKTVSNTLRVPFVKMVFPEARLIHLIRDGRDVVESAMRMWQAPLDNGYLLRKLKYIPWSNISYLGWFLKNRMRQIRLLWRRENGDRAVWGPRYRGINADLNSLPLLQICARQWKFCVESARRGLAELPPETVLEVRYEDLVSEEDVIVKVAEFVGVSDVESVLGSYRANVRSDLGGRWQLLGEVNLELLYSEIGATLTNFGYHTDSRPSNE